MLRISHKMHNSDYGHSGAFLFYLVFFHYARVIGSFLLEHYSGRPTDWLLTLSMKPQKVNTHRVETIKKLPERRYLILGEFYHN